MNKFGQTDKQGGGQTIERAEREIEATRSVITEDLHALGEKFTPEHLKNEVSDAARAVVGSARHAVGDKVSKVENRARRASSQAVTAIREQADKAKRNPFALAGVGLLAGLGIGLLLPVSQAEAHALAKPTRVIREQARDALTEGKESARRLREGAQDAAAEVKEALQEGSESFARTT